MCEPCERECLAYVQDFLRMDLVTQQWISGSVWRSTIGWSKWLHNTPRSNLQEEKKEKNSTHLDWNVVLKVQSVFGIAGFGTEWGRVTMSVGPVDPTKEGMCLQNCVRGVRNKDEPSFFRARLALGAAGSP
jgi:hypothetical protein